MLSFRHTKQTSKNVADTTFNKSVCQLVPLFVLCRIDEDIQGPSRLKESETEETFDKTIESSHQSDKSLT